MKSKFRVLVACEYSGAVRDAFIRAGHYAASCDILPSESFLGDQTDSGQNKLPPSADRWKIRSETYQGIADAMANQWSKL